MAVKFDFEEMRRLAESDPAAFEKKRKELIESTIQEAPPEHQERLRRLQWVIDMDRKKCKTPLAACVRLNSMMINQVYREGGFLDSLRMVRNPDSIKLLPASKKAKVIKFEKKEE